MGDGGVGLVSGFGGLSKSCKTRGGVEGAPSTSGSERRQGEVLQKDGERGMAFDAVESGLNVQEGGGGPAGDLIGRGLPPGDPDGLPAIIEHDVFNGVGGEQRDVQGGGHVEPMQGDELVAGLVETGEAGGIARGHEGPQRGQRFAASVRALGEPQSPPQPFHLRMVPLPQIAVEIAFFVHEAALGERVGPGGQHRGLQGGGAIQHHQQAMAGERPEAASLQAGDQGSW